MSGKSPWKRFYRRAAFTAAVAATFAGASFAAESPVAAQETGGAETVEADVRQGFGALLDGRAELSLRRTVPLVRRQANFQLGRLLYADLLAARAHQKTLLALPAALKKTRVKGLVEEAKARLLYRSPPDERLPDVVMRLSRRHRYAFVIDAARSRIYVFANKEGAPVLLADYYASVGNGGVGKTSEGDEKTPLGVYYPTSYLENDRLPELYGVGAYPLNYPNKWDRLNGRDGSGIWLHGTPFAVYSRPPQDSRGCVVISNQLLTGLSSRIDVGRTPMILAASVEWLPPAEWRARRDRLLDAIHQWRRDWQSLDVERYLGHYSRDYRSKGMNYEQAAAVTRRNAKKKTFVEVEIRDLDLFEYPGEKDVVVAVFDQDYRSNNYKLRYRKQQFWKYQDGRWMIIFEDRADNAPSA